MRHASRLGVQGGLHNGRDLLDGIGGLASGSDLPQTVQSLFSKSLTPQHDRFPVDRVLPGNGEVGLAAGYSQHDPATQGYLLRCPLGGNPLLQLLLLGSR